MPGDSRCQYVVVAMLVRDTSEGLASSRNVMLNDRASFTPPTD